RRRAGVRWAGMPRGVEPTGAAVGAARCAGARTWAVDAQSLSGADAVLSSVASHRPARIGGTGLPACWHGAFWGCACLYRTVLSGISATAERGARQTSAAK